MNRNTGNSKKFVSKCCQRKNKALQTHLPSNLISIHSFICVWIFVSIHPNVSTHPHFTILTFPPNRHCVHYQLLNTLSHFAPPKESTPMETTPLPLYIVTVFPNFKNNYPWMLLFFYHNMLQKWLPSRKMPLNNRKGRASTAVIDCGHLCFHH